MMVIKILNNVVIDPSSMLAPLTENISSTLEPVGGYIMLVKGVTYSRGFGIGCQKFWRSPAAFMAILLMRQCSLVSWLDP